jgi:cell division transport system permease protein
MIQDRDKRFQNRAKLKAKQREKLKASAPQTKKAGGNFQDRLNAYFAFHAQALFSSLGRLLATPFTSIMTTMVLAVAIAAATGFYILWLNVAQLTGNLESSNQISLFLKQEVDDKQGKELQAQLQQNPRVESVKLLTKDNSLAEFKSFSGFAEAIDALETNPLPTVIEVLPKNSLDNNENLQQLLTEFQRLPEVDIAQLDMQWVRKLQSMVELIKSGMLLLNFGLSFAILFVMGNTIRLELEGRREEVLISKLVGATYSFIKRPYLYTGFWFGFFAGVVAWLMVTFMMLILKQPIENLFVLYEKSYSVVFLDFFESLSVLFISAMLGVLGAWLVLYYQLKQMKLE